MKNRVKWKKKYYNEAMRTDYDKTMSYCVLIIDTILKCANEKLFRKCANEKLFRMCPRKSLLKTSEENHSSYLQDLINCFFFQTPIQTNNNNNNTYWYFFHLAFISLQVMTTQ